MIFEALDDGRSVLEPLVPEPVRREYKTTEALERNSPETKKKWDEWLAARADGRFEDALKKWSELGEEGFSKIELVAPFISAWRVQTDPNENKEPVGMTCAKWETMCLLQVVALRNALEKPLNRRAVQRAMTCWDRSANELREWIAEGNLVSTDEEIDGLVEVDPSFYDCVSEMCRVLYHAATFREFVRSNETDHETIAENGGMFLALIEDARATTAFVLQRRSTSHASRILQDLSVETEKIIFADATKLMVEKCKKLKRWDRALFWQDLIVEEELKEKSFWSLSSTPGQEERDHIVRLGGSVCKTTPPEKQSLPKVPKIASFF